MGKKKAYITDIRGHGQRSEVREKVLGPSGGGYREERWWKLAWLEHGRINAFSKRDNMITESRVWLSTVQ